MECLSLQGLHCFVASLREMGVIAFFCNDNRVWTWVVGVYMHTISRDLNNHLHNMLRYVLVCDVIYFAR